MADAGKDWRREAAAVNIKGRGEGCGLEVRTLGWEKRATVRLVDAPGSESELKAIRTFGNAVFEEPRSSLP